MNCKDNSKSLFHVSCQDSFREPEPPLKKEKAPNHLPHKHLRDQFCILACTSSPFKALLLQMEVNKLAFWDMLQSLREVLDNERGIESLKE